MLLCVGCVVVGTAHHFGQAVAGMSIAGAGAGIGELTGLAGYVDQISLDLDNANVELAWPRQYQSNIVDIPSQH